MTKNRYWMFNYLALKDGQKCKSCGAENKELVIDHIDGNRQNENPANLRLLCRSCNRKNLIELRSSISVNERERIDDEAAVEQESAELKVAREKQPDYVKWLYENIGREGGLTFWAAIYEGADDCDISPVTARRYLYKKLAKNLRLGEGVRGHRRIFFRDEAK
jgi:hypothetical protein